MRMWVHCATSRGRYLDCQTIDGGIDGINMLDVAWLLLVDIRVILFLFFFFLLLFLILLALARATVPFSCALEVTDVDGHRLLVTHLR